MSNFSISLVIGASVGGAVAGLTQVRNSLATLRDDSLSTTQKMATLGKLSVASFGTAISSATGIGAAVIGFAQPAIEFESVMSGVAKQLEGARDSTGKLTQEFYKARSEILQMGREAPVAIGQIAEVWEQGLKTGVAKENLQEFATMAISAGEAFGTSAVDLSETMGRVGKLYHRDMGGMRDLMDRINYLDDNAESSGADILTFMQNVGGTASQIKISDTQLAAYGSTLLTLGEKADTASTAMNAVFSKLGAAKTQAKPFQDMLKRIGFSPEEIADGMQKDANATIAMLNDRIKSLPTLSDGKNPTQIDAVSTLFGGEHWDTYSKFLSGNELDRQLKLADSDDAKGSMVKEYEARKQTTEAQMQMFKNRLGEVAVTLGDALLPAINGVMASFAPLVSSFADWAKENPNIINGVVKLGAVLTAGVIGFSLIGGVVSGVMAIFAGFSGAMVGVARVSSIAFKMIAGQYGLVSGLMRMGLPVRGFLKFSRTVTGLFTGGFNLIKSGITALTSAFGRLGSLSGVFNVLRVAAIGFGKALLTTPIGWLALALAGVALVVYKYWTPISSFFLGLWGGIMAGVAPLQSTFSRLWQTIMGAFAPLQGVFDGLVGIFGGLWASISPFVQPILDWFLAFFTQSQQGAESANAFGQTVGGVIIGILTTVIQIGASIIGAWASILGAIISAAVSIWQGVSSVFMGAIGFISSLLSSFNPSGIMAGVLGAVIGVASAIWASIRVVFVGAVNGLMTVIRGFSPVSAFSTAFSAVWGFLSGLAGRFRTFGVNIIQGLIGGIKSMAGAVVGAISSTVGNVAGTAKRMLGINSPSRVFRRFGLGISKGLAIGIDKGGDKPVSAIGSVASGVTANFGAKMGNLSAHISTSVGEHQARMTNTNANNSTNQQQGNITIHFNPTINAGGNDMGKIERALQLSQAEFEKMFARMQQDKLRRAY